MVSVFIFTAFSIEMSNSVDPDHMVHLAVSELGLQHLQNTPNEYLV